MRHFVSVITSAALLLSPIAPAASSTQAVDSQAAVATTTPIKHLVVIFGENVSFDHYFGTYPIAANPPGQPRFTALPGTPTVNNYILSPTLLSSNPNLNVANNSGASNPFRLNRNQALTASQNHSYLPEQQSFDLGLMDRFPLRTGKGGGTPNTFPQVVNTTGLVMGYYDGNTVTALWNYAQHFAMSDNSYNSTFGPSTPGAINLISGQTNGIGASTNGPSSNEVADGRGGFTLIGDAEALNDACSSTGSFNAQMTGKNVGDLMNTAGVTWGWFQGGFDTTITNPNGSHGCSRSTVSPITGNTVTDYVDHHQPFQYYASTANPTHARPTSVSAIGTGTPANPEPANHQYDTHDFFDALNAGNLPAVSFLKAAAYQDGHPSNSNPLDEQAFIVNVVNALEASPFWSTTAVVVAYDDSDGWYDHQAAPIVNGSFTNQDALSGSSACGINGTTPVLAGPNSGGLSVQGRCSPGVRTPLLVISPWAKPNFVDHTFTMQTSILVFIEQNWSLGTIGGGSLDTVALSIANMFDFSKGTPQNSALLTLSPTSGLPQ